MSQSANVPIQRLMGLNL